MRRASRQLWVYKCNASRHADRIASGDWDVFLAEFVSASAPVEWGGSTTMASRRSLQILWERMRVGDLVLAWQTDRRVAVLLCRIAKFADWHDREGRAQRDMFLEVVGDPFSPPVPLSILRKKNAQLARVRCFKSGPIDTLYETSAQEAQTLLRACGVAKVIPRPKRGAPVGALSGAGFGTAAENKKVEAAAIAVFKRTYAKWRIRDVQRQNLGYDFEATSGRRTRHIEVKGSRSSGPAFPITKGEVECANVDPEWRLFAVTDALSKRRRSAEWSAPEFLRSFELRELAFIARLKSNPTRGKATT